MGAGDGFGFLSPKYLSNITTQQMIRADTPTDMVVIKIDIFEKIVNKAEIKRQNKIVDFLMKLQCF